MKVSDRHRTLLLGSMVSLTTLVITAGSKRSNSDRLLEDTAGVAQMTLALVRHGVTTAHRHCVTSDRTRVDTSAPLRAGQHVDVAPRAEQTQVSHARHCNTHSAHSTQ